mgnify:CR=1 FL=1
MKASILLAIKREQRNRRSDGFLKGLQAQRETKTESDAVITHVTQVTVEEPTSELPKTQAEWAKELGIQKQTLTKYMKRHECTLEEAVEYYKSR